MDRDGAGGTSRWALGEDPFAVRAPRTATLRRSPTARACDRAWRGQPIPLRAILRGAMPERSGQYRGEPLNGTPNRAGAAAQDTADAEEAQDSHLDRVPALSRESRCIPSPGPSGPSVVAWPMPCVISLTWSHVCLSPGVNCAWSFDRSTSDLSVEQGDYGRGIGSTGPCSALRRTK